MPPLIARRAEEIERFSHPLIARAVVIAEHPVRPASGRQQTLIFVDQLGDRARVPVGLQETKVERQMATAQIAA